MRILTNNVIIILFMDDRRTSSVSGGERWSDASNWDWIMNVESDYEIPPLGALDLPRPPAPVQSASPLPVNTGARPPIPLPQAHSKPVSPLPWVIVM